MKSINHFYSASNLESGGWTQRMNQTFFYVSGKIQYLDNDRSKFLSLFLSQHAQLFIIDENAQPNKSIFEELAN